MSNSQFKIHGKKRKTLKKEISLLKRGKKSFWHHFSIDKDMRMAYGDYDGCLNDESAKRIYNDICKNIEVTEKKLKIPYGRSNDI